jgi:hypothetical protein
MLFLRDSNEVEYELLRENTTMIEPGIRESLISEPLDWVRKNANSGVVVEISQMGLFIK